MLRKISFRAFYATAAMSVAMLSLSSVILPAATYAASNNNQNNNNQNNNNNGGNNPAPRGGNNGNNNGNFGNNGNNNSIIGRGGNGNNAANGPTNASAIQSQCSHPFFGLIPWYNYLGPEFNATSQAANHGVSGDNCTIKCFNFFSQTQPNDCGVTHSDIPYVLLAIVDDLLRVVGIIAVAFVFVGAFNYVTSQGDPDGTAHAQNTIINALIGVAIAAVAVAFVSYLGSKL